MRIFIAIDLPGEVKEKLGSIIREMRTASEQGRFVKEELLHLTLEFMGSLDEEGLRRLTRVLDFLAFDPFSLTLGQLGSFRGYKGRTWWIGVETSKELHKLQADLKNLLATAGFSLEDRPFHPHITLGRDIMMKEGMNPKQQDLAGLKFRVLTIHVMESESFRGVLSYSNIYNIQAGRF